MSTVRVYKVAELLDIASADVLALLKKDHGIELKSASSSLEEIVARQFVERLAKQKGITLPKGDMFSEAAVKQARTASKAKVTPGKKGVAAPGAGTGQAGGADAGTASADQEADAGQARGAEGRRGPGR